MFNSSAAVLVAEQPFYPLILLLCYPQTWQHLSGVWHSPHQTKHKDLLLYCYSTVKASWLHPHNPQTYAQRGGKVGLEGHQESKRLCWIFILCSNYYFFFSSRWLSPLYFSSQVEVLASHLALKQVHCKHTFGGMIFILFVQYFTHPSVLYLHSINTGVSAKNSAWVYSCTNMIRALTNTADRLLYEPFHLFLEVQKPLVDSQTDKSTPSTSVSSSSVSNPDPSLCPQGIL